MKSVTSKYLKELNEAINWIGRKSKIGKKRFYKGAKCALRETTKIFEKTRAETAAIKKRLNELLEDPQFERFLDRFAIELGLDFKQTPQQALRVALQSSNMKVRITTKLTILSLYIRKYLITGSLAGAASLGSFPNGLPLGAALGFSTAAIYVLICGYEAYMTGQELEPSRT